MDIDKIVIVTPNPNPTGDPKLDELTARVSHDDNGQQLGKLHRGEVYRAVEEYLGKYRLIVWMDNFPFPVLNGVSVWADARFLPEVAVAPEPEPIPASDGSLKSLANKLGHALIEWSEE